MWSFVLACGTDDGDESRARCDDVSAQIEQALEDNIDTGVLVGTAVGCALTPESFDPRVDPANVDYLVAAFENACAIQAQECSGISTPPGPPVPPPTASPPPAAEPRRTSPPTRVGR
ncbi:MAG TPA: hypothetical protein VJU61_27440 [Polyangiaceae bacterium]|nr:hypothetical protein [Polyangiaceae bacterium]